MFQASRFEHLWRWALVMPITGSRTHCWSTAGHPGPPSSYKHQSRVWHSSKVCNCAPASSQQCLQTLTLSILYRFISERSLYTHFFLLFHTISAPSPLTYIWRGQLLSWQTLLKTMISINAGITTVYKHNFQYRLSILSVFLEASV